MRFFRCNIVGIVYNIYMEVKCITMDNKNSIIPLNEVVEAIKTAIMQGQYEALKNVNRVQLAVYYAIGKYLSKNTRKLAYGSGALKAISNQIHYELPGLRGFSETQLRDMRRFYESWQILDAEKYQVADEYDPNSAVATAELQTLSN